jgi:hypothetical protein
MPFLLVGRRLRGEDAEVAEKVAAGGQELSAGFGLCPGMRSSSEGCQAGLSPAVRTLKP